MSKLRSVFLTQLVIRYLNISSAVSVTQNGAMAFRMGDDEALGTDPPLQDTYGIFFVPGALTVPPDQGHGEVNGVEQ